jgi:transketolase
MGGISHENHRAGLAPELVSKLVALCDDNGISIDGQVAPWFIDNTPTLCRLRLERDRRGGQP